MPLQNRVTPFGEIAAAPWRGSFTGNRGCLHDADRRLGTARWRTHAWVCCVLSFRGRWREPMPPRRWTALFFWDEAVALAAGHRPCGECRYRDHQRFKAAWRAAGLPGHTAREIDKVLHPARVTRDRRQLRHAAAFADLPDGAFYTAPDAPETPALKWRGDAWAWSPEGYRPARERSETVTVLTPAPMLHVLASGYVPQVALRTQV